MDAIDVARAAFAGKDVPETKVVNFASYIGRMERGHKDTRNPKLDVIERIAFGFGLTLSAFFAKIESGTGHETGRGVSGGPLLDRPIRPVPAEDVPRLYEEIGRLVVSAVARQQTPAARPRRARGRKSHRKNR